MAKSLNVRNTHGEVRMTDGSLWKNMLIFSAPLMLSQLLQVLFNMADVAVVGKYSSAEAFGCGRLNDHPCNAVYRLSNWHGKRC